MPSRSRLREILLLGDNPWWIPPLILGRVPPAIDARRVSLLGFVSFALFFEQYDLSLLSNALKYICDDLGIAETQLGYFQMLIRLGALPAFLLIPLTDQIGRRRLFLASLVGMSVGTVLTGLAQSAAQFVAFQMLTRTFVLTASAVSVVIVTEEFPAAHRGWGLGMLAAIGAVGHGLGALLFAAVEDLPFEWRALYVVGVLPILLLPLFRRGITETERFRSHQQAIVGSAALRGWLRPVLGLVRTHPGRASALAGVLALAALGHAVVINFTAYFVLEYHDWRPYQLSAMVITAGAVGLIGNVVAGRLADEIGRRRVGLGFLAVFPASAWLFFYGPSLALAPLWAVLVFTLMGGNVILRALSTELFPTSHRGTSAGVLALMETLGAAFGMYLLGSYQQERGDLVFLIPLLSTACLLAGLALLFFPETSQRELEALSREEAETGPAESNTAVPRAPRASALEP